MSGQDDYDHDQHWNSNANGKDNGVAADLMSLVAGRKSKKNRALEFLGSDSDQDDSHLSVVVDSEPETATREDGQIEEDGEESSSFVPSLDEEEEVEEENDGFDEDLMGDADDRARLAAMPEVEREAILFERSQARSLRLERLALQRQVREMEASRMSAAHRPGRALSREADGKRQSLEALKAARQQKKSQRRRRNFGDDEDDEDYYQEDEDEYPRRKTGRKRTMDSDEEYDDFYGSDEKSLGRRRGGRSMIDEEPLDLADANAMQVTRDDFCRFVFHPDFDRTASGCFVRLSVGMRSGSPVYRLVEIKKIVQYHRTYRVQGSSAGVTTETNKAAILRYGKQERTFRLDAISNSPFNESEFVRWRDTLKEEKVPIIPKAVAMERSRDWRHLVDTPLSDQIITVMVTAKRDLIGSAGSGGGGSGSGSSSRNLVAERTMLRGLYEEARTQSNAAEMARIEEELAQLEQTMAQQKAQQTMSTTQQRLEAVSRRNRTLNITAAVDQASIAKKTFANSDNKLDPFSRRKCKPSGFTGIDDEPSMSNATSNPIVNLDASNFKTVDTNDSTLSVKSTNSKTSVNMHHAVDIDLDL